MEMCPLYIPKARCCPSTVHAAHSTCINSLQEVVFLKASQELNSSSKHNQAWSISQDYKFLGAHTWPGVIVKKIALQVKWQLWTLDCALCLETDFCSGDQIPKSVAVPLASCKRNESQSLFLNTEPRSLALGNWWNRQAICSDMQSKVIMTIFMLPSL